MPETAARLAEAIFEMSKRTWRQAARATSEVTESEFLALDFLGEVGLASVGDITRAVEVLPAQTSRIVRSLERQGLITCDINAEDKRKVNVRLTAKGKRIHARYRLAKLDPIHSALQRLSPREQKQFMTLVNKMVAR